MCRMGKTIQMIALLLSDIGAKPNLVVAYVRLQLALTIITESACRPTVAIMQWRNEIELHTDNLLKTLVWHGSSRESSVQELKKYDVVCGFRPVCVRSIAEGLLKVLTSYAVLESCFRKEHNGFKRKGRIVKEKSPLHAINWNRVIVSVS